jgi:hypothetical protein
MKKILILTTVVAVLLGALVAVLRYTSVADSYLVSVKRNPQVPPPTMEGMAKRFHTAAGPCLRFWEGAAPEEELTRTAEAFIQAGISSQQLTSLAGIFLGWSVDREAAVHARSEEEEWIEAITEGLSLPVRALFWLRRESLRRMLVLDHTKHYAEGTAALGKLSPEQQARVRALWEEHAAALTISSIIPLRDALQHHETREKLEVLARAIEEHVSQGHPVPERLDELTGLEPEALRDGWDNAFSYDPTLPDGVRVISLGYDDTLGGSGPDADTFRDVVLRKAAPEARPGERERPVAACGALPAMSVVSRAEYDGAWADLNRVAMTARIVPAFNEGEVYGFKFFALQPGSPFALAGLCDDDVVMEVAGIPLTTPENALELYSRLRGARTVSLKVQRKGVAGELTLRVE